MLDRLPGHEKIFFGSDTERAFDIEKTRLDDDDRNRDAVLMAHDELQIRPILNLRPAAARAAKKRELHAVGIDRSARSGQVRDKLIGAGKADLRIAHAKARHALQEHHSIRYRDFEVGLLQPVTQAGIEQL